MSRSRSLFLFILGFFVGILLASFDVMPSAEILAVGGVILSATWYWKIVRVRAIFIVLLGFWFALIRFWLALPHVTPQDVAFYRDTGQKFELEGLLLTEPDIRSDEQIIVIDTKQLVFGTSHIQATAAPAESEMYVGGSAAVVEVHGKVRIKGPRYPEFRYGDLLSVTCLLESPQNFEKFFFAQVLAKDGIFVLCNRPSIKILARGQGNTFWAAVFWLKNSMLDRINRLFTEPEASIVAGVLLGVRRSIPQSVLDDFSTAGLSHTLAISGYNINLMIAVFGMFFVSSSRRARFFGMLGGILLFLLFTGFSGSVIRAAWMGFFVILAKTSGRKGTALHILMLSSFCMVLFNPYVLAFDLSFELSFLATLGLVVCMPRFEKFFEHFHAAHPGNFFARVPDFLSEGFWVTMAAQVFTTPLTLFYFGKFSLIAPFANVLFLPFIPWIMLFSFVALVISFVWMPLATPFTILAWICLKILLGGVGIAAKIPWAALQFY